MYGGKPEAGKEQEDRRMKSKVDALKELRDYCRIQQAMYEDDQIEVGDFTYGKPIIRKWDNETTL